MKKRLVIFTISALASIPAFAKNYECAFAIDEGAEVIPHVKPGSNPNIKYLQRGRVGKYEVSVFIEDGRTKVRATLNGVKVAQTSTGLKGEFLELSFGNENVQCDDL